MKEMIVFIFLLLLLNTQYLYGQTSVTSGITQAGYSLNTSAIAVDPGITITSASSINGFKVTVSSGKKTSDVLSYTGTLPSGITVTPYNSSTGVLTFNGTTSAANWQAFLRTVTFQNTDVSQYGDRTITFSAGSLSAASNGHFYELVSSTGSWTTCKSNAEARTYLGYTGYLATITSANENSFIRQVLNADAWIGCSDSYTQINAATGVTTYANQSAAEGKWYWVTGPEKGTMFSVGNGSPVTQSGQYANWNSGEPNNVGSEHYGEIYSSGSTPGAWNDLPNSVSLAYVVEYGGLATDPVQTISSNTTIYTNISSNTASGSQVICNGASATTITGATPYGGYGTYTYKWISSTTGPNTGFSDAGGTITGANYSPGTLTTTTYYRRVVTSGSLSDTSAVITKTVNPAISSSYSTTGVSCNGFSNGQASITPSGGTTPFTYAWSTGATGTSVAGLNAGTYTCTVTDANGCTHTRNFTITEPSALTAGSSSSNVLCNGASTGSASVSPSGGTPSYTYSWSPSGGTAANANNLTAGSYTCLITDANACTVAKTVTIIQPSAISITPSSVNISCNGGASGSASVTVSGGSTPYAYAWSNGSSNSSVTSLASGTYTCTVTDANACTSVQSFTLTQPAALTAGTAQTNVSCNGGANGTASVTVGGGTAGYTYVWSPAGGNSATATGLSSGSYTCMVTDANGCTITRNYTITQPAALAATTAATNVSCHGESNGTASLLASGGTPSYSYSWAPAGGNAATATGLSAGSYSCTLTDANGCILVRNYTISEPSALSVSSNVTNVSCNGGANASASVTVSGGTSPFTYVWSGGGTAATNSGLTAGNYTCTITDSNGCTSLENITVSEPSALSASVTVTGVSCNGGSDGAASMSVSGGTSGYTYSWSPSGGTTSSATGLAAGTYTCAVTDANGCTYATQVSVSQPAAISATVTTTDVDCYGNSNGTATVAANGGTGALSYSWSPVGGTSAAASALQGGTYICTITDANGCTTQNTVTINEPSAALSVNLGGSDVTCNGTATGLAASGVSGGTFPYTYVWSNGNTNGAQNNLTAGTYTCTITDANGCTTQASLTIAEPPAIALSVSVTDPLCNGMNGGASVTATGGTGNISLSWSNGGTGSSMGNLSAGTYSITAMDDNFCTSDQTITVSEPAAISSTISATDPLCNGGTGSAGIITTGGTGAYTYLWSTGGTSDTETSLPAGQYTFTITDANGCTFTDLITINEPAALQLTTASTDPLCNGGTGTASVSVNGGTGTMTYIWTSGGTSDTETNLSAGTYSVMVTDQNGCTETSSITITEPAAITLSATTGDENCNQLNGSITVTATGGTGNYAYLWNNGGTSDLLAGLAAGTYTLTVTDDNGCTWMQNFTVNAAGVPLAVVNSTNLLCNGDSNGSIDLQVSAGSGNYSYLWSNGETTSNIQGLSAGTYTYTVTDGTNCSTTASVSITEPPAISAAATTSNEISGNDGSIDLTVTGGTPAYTYNWSDGSTTEDISGLMAGDYTVSITDGNGCTFSATFTVSSSTGLENEHGNTSQLMLYPNPGKGVFTLKSAPVGNYRIMDGHSRLITEFQVQSREEMKIDLSHLSAGVYYLHAVNDPAGLKTRLVILK